MEPSSDTTNLFRPNQVQEARAELKALNDMLRQDNPARGKISDPREMRRRSKRLADDIQRLEPKAYSTSEKDAAVREFKELGAKIKRGMPSSEEMRRNPPGAVERHMSWEKRAKPLINRWKHVGLRLEAGGDVPAEMDIPGASINVEVLRDLKTDWDLPMDGAQIPKSRDFHFGADVANTVVFSDEDEAALREVAPDLAASLATMDNAARAQVKALLKLASGSVTSPSPVPAGVEPSEKPAMADLNFQAMQKMAKKEGMNTFAQSKSAIATWLRARHLIR